MIRLLLAVTLILASCATAYAARPATPEEHAAIVKATGGAQTVECTVAEVSTVNAAWATLGANFDREQCGSDVALTLFVLDGYGDWIYTGYAQNITQDHVCPIAQIPSRVTLDLELCRPPVHYLLCGERFARRPRSCNTLTDEKSFAESRNLRKLKWSSWGGPVARGRGINIGYHLDDEPVPVRIKLFRRLKLGSSDGPDVSPKCRGDWLYTRMQIRSKYGTSTQSIEYEPCT